MASSVPQNPTSNNVAALLPKLNDADSDLRYMSLNDLFNILNAGSHSFLLNDYNTCARTVDGLLKTLDDQNGEVQNQAIKWYEDLGYVPSMARLTLLFYSLGPFAAKVPPEILPPLIEKLSNLKPTNSVDSSIPATALRTLIISFSRPIQGIPPSKASEDAYSAISKVLIPRLVGYIILPHGLKNHPAPPPGMLEVSNNVGVDSDAIDVLIEVVRCFGPMLHEAEKQALQRAVMDILDNDRTSTVIKKKVVTAISLLAIFLSDSLLSAFFSSIIESFHNVHLTLPKRRLLISMIGSLARSIPQRLGPHLKIIAPFILSALSEQEYEESLEELAEDGTLDPMAEEVREAALIAVEGFLSMCINEMRMFTNEAIEAGLRFVRYDPNSSMNEDNNDTDSAEEAIHEEGGANDIDEAEEDFEEEGGMSDDDDSSWKVRRCAAKVLYTIVWTRGSGDLLEDGTLYDKIAPVLINSFNEREENVRLEVLATLAVLIRKTGEGASTAVALSDDEGYVSASHTNQSRKRRRGGSDASMFDNQGPISSTRGVISPATSPSPTSGPKADLARLSTSLIQGVAKLLKHTSVPTKQCAIMLLKDFVLVQNGGLSKNLGKISDSLIEAIKTSSTVTGGLSSASTGASVSATGSSLRIEALQLVSAICDTHSSKIILPYVERIVPAVIAAVRDRYFKISSEAIRVVESVVKVLTPPRSSSTGSEYRVYLGGLFDVLAIQAQANDADLEVRQRAIHAFGVLLARTSEPGSSKLLSTEKRATGLDILYDRLKNEITRLATVQAIDTILVTVSDKDELRTIWIRNVALELAGQLRKSNRTLRNSSMGALKSMTGNSVAVAALDSKTIQALEDMLLPLLDTRDLSLLGLAMAVLADLVKRNPKKVVNRDLNTAICKVVLTPLGGRILDAFLNLVDTVGSASAGQPLMGRLLKNIGVAGDPAVVGTAIGTLLVSGGSTVGVSIDDFIRELQAAQDDQRKCLALSVLGEAGLRLGTSSPLQPKLFMSYFKSQSEQVPRAAAVALGRAGAGNVSVYLPSILSMMSQMSSQTYLLLHSIKEVLQFAGRLRISISAYTREIWKTVLAASQAEDNKAIGAECIGRLISIEPKTYLPLLQVRSFHQSEVFIKN